MDRFFGITAQGSTVRREVVAGVTTFLTMAYIMFLNPLILADAGMDKGAVFVATCLASAFATLIMALYANYPIALAPGMGINAFFTYGVVIGLHYSWQAALGAVFISGILFLILSLTPLREWMIGGIPKSQEMAIAAGIGLFLGILALKGAGVIAADKETYVTLGDLHAPSAILAAVGFIAMVALESRRVPGAILIVVLGVTAAGIVLGISPFGGVVSMPPSLAPTFGQMSFTGAPATAIALAVFSFLLIDMLDTSGTLTAVAHQANLLEKDGRLKNARRALASDAIGTMIGAAVGTSPVTAYIESAAGVQAGGRTGLTAVVVAALFLASLFLAPLAQTVPPYATAPALLFVACLMATSLGAIQWDEPTEYIPALTIALMIPLSYSIATGIGLGFIAYVALKLMSGRFRDINAASAVIAAAFLLKLIFA